MSLEKKESQVQSLIFAVLQSLFFIFLLSGCPCSFIHLFLFSVLIFS